MGPISGSSPPVHPRSNLFDARISRTNSRTHRGADDADSKQILAYAASFRLSQISKGTSSSATKPAASELPELAEADFEKMVLEGKVSQSKRPFLVFVTSKSCGPCRLLKPVVEEVAKKFADKVDFFAMDLEKTSTGFRERWDCKKIPTLLLFSEGKLMTRLVGASESDKKKDERRVAKMLAPFTKFR